MTEKPKEKSTLKEKLLCSLIATIAFLYVSNVLLDDRPAIYKDHKAELLQYPVKLSTNRIYDLNLKSYYVNEIANDKPTILMFWATWCGYCSRELPEVAEFYAKHKDKVNIIPISYGDSVDEIKSFYKRNGGGQLVSYLTKNSFMQMQLEARAVPTFILVDQNSNAIARLRPKWHKDDVFQLVNRLILDAKAF